MKLVLGTEVGLSPGDFVLEFSAHFYCGQTAACIKMPLGVELALSTGDFVLDGDSAPLSQIGTDPQFSAHIYGGQMAAWIKMSLGMMVGLGRATLC